MLNNADESVGPEKKSVNQLKKIINNRLSIKYHFKYGFIRMHNNNVFIGINFAVCMSNLKAYRPSIFITERRWIL